jgi:hypothetical protein
MNSLSCLRVNCDFFTLGGEIILGIRMRYEFCLVLDLSVYVVIGLASELNNPFGISLGVMHGCVLELLL